MTCATRDLDKHNMGIALRLEGKTYAEIGKELGVTRQRAQQICRPPLDVINAVIARAHGRCERCDAACGRTGHIHHRRAVGMTPEVYNAPENLGFLCTGCHMAVHTRPRQIRSVRIINSPEERAATAGARALNITREEWLAHRADGERWCSWHKAWESAESFSPAGRRSGSCRTGAYEAVRHYAEKRKREGVPSYYERNREKANAYHKAWVARNPEKRKAYNAKTYARTKAKRAAEQEAAS